MKNSNASALGKLAAGVSKRFTAAEIARRKKRLAIARRKRWAIANGIASIEQENQRLREALERFIENEFTPEWVKVIAQQALATDKRG